MKARKRSVGEGIFCKVSSVLSPFFLFFKVADPFLASKISRGRRPAAPLVGLSIALADDSVRRRGDGFVGGWNVLTPTTSRSSNTRDVTVRRAILSKRLQWRVRKDGALTFDL